MDSARSRTPVPLKKVPSKDQSRVSVRAMSSYSGSGRRGVPDEYKTFDRGGSSGWGFIAFLFLLFAATIGGFYYWNSRPPVVQGDSVVTMNERLGGRFATLRDVIAGGAMALSGFSVVRLQ